MQKYKVEVELPDGEYCDASGNRCQFHDFDGRDFCNLLQGGMLEPGQDELALKHENCPAKEIIKIPAACYWYCARGPK